MFMDSDYFTFHKLSSRLNRYPRFSECVVKVHGLKLQIPDAPSFLSAYKEIFVEKIYDFKSETEVPKILDLGANIGLSVLFFKRLYPMAQITAFEADPKIFESLKKNVHGNGYTDVELINKAAWHENTLLRFRSEGADGGRAAVDGDENLIEVEAIDIAQFIKNERFDFLKMDIEGAEEVVLPACKDFLSGIKFVFVEYHSKVNKKQSLKQVVCILADAGFRIHIHSVMCSPSPFVKRETNSGFDLQLNIFGWRE
jgi:FkbM family methyltransferase